MVRSVDGRLAYSSSVVVGSHVAGVKVARTPTFKTFMIWKQIVAYGYTVCTVVEAQPYTGIVAAKALKVESIYSIGCKVFNGNRVGV
jgi:hypothetical protein